MKILIVEDNKILSNNIYKFLELEGIQSKQIFDGIGIPLELKNDSYDLIIMDLGLGEQNGIDIIKQIRESNQNLPVLILTARDTIKDKINGFNSGADDYLTKPFNYEELILRINALIRRNYTNKNDITHIGSIEIDKNNKIITMNSTVIHLSKLEFDLLTYLVNYKGKIISKKELLEKVWGEYDDFFPSRTVDIYVGYLRKKLGKNLIDTIRGEGYIIK
ncbi:MAG: response regulator transcription factor [Candidatus Gracilibacteria bacterium]|nr:response regulator transcription factor [Candidatus Gracilibacteria bacterium]